MNLTRINRSLIFGLNFRLNRHKIRHEAEFKKFSSYNEQEVASMLANVTFEPPTMPDSAFTKSLDEFHDYVDILAELNVTRKEKIHRQTTGKFGGKNPQKYKGRYAGVHVLTVETNEQYYAPGRISIVDINGDLLYDRVINCGQKIVDFRDTNLSQKDIQSGIDFDIAKKEVLNILDGRAVIVHKISDLILAFGINPIEYYDIAHYPRLQYIIMTLNNIQYSGILNLEDMIKFTVNDKTKMDPSNCILAARKIVEIFLIVKDKIEAEKEEEKLKNLLENQSTYSTNSLE